MPKYRIFIFSGVFAGFLLLISLSIIMTYPRYQKSMEQLPELIAADTSNVNPALLQIKDYLAQIESTGEDPEKEAIVWTGSVCASKYMMLSGSERIYYICPYIIRKVLPVSANSTVEWTFSLQFALCALEDGALREVNTNIHVDDIQFTCRVGEGALIVSAGYGDGEMSEINGRSVSYQFRNRSNVNMDTNVFASLSVTTASSEGEQLPDSETAVMNWAFSIWEKNHEIGTFDDIQIEVPYLFSR